MQISVFSLEISAFLIKILLYAHRYLLQLQISIINRCIMSFKHLRYLYFKQISTLKGMYRYLDEKISVLYDIKRY